MSNYLDATPKRIPGISEVQKPLTKGEQLPDENGDLFPGELGGGGYGAMEGDLGEKLRPLAGFGRPLEPVEEEEENILDWFIPEGVRTSEGAVVYTVDWGKRG